jgi:hypothetical protein
MFSLSRLKYCGWRAVRGTYLWHPYAGLTSSRTSDTIRMLSPTSSSGSNNATGASTGAIVGAILGALTFICVAFWVARAARRKRQQEERAPVGVQGQIPTGTPVTIRPPSSPAPHAPSALAAIPNPFEYSGIPATTSAAPLQQPPDDRTVEVNRRREEIDALMTAMCEQPRQQDGVCIHGEHGGWGPPPEYQRTELSDNWQPELPPGLPPDGQLAIPQSGGES